MKRLTLFLTAACLATVVFAGTVNYTADDETIFPNPERGFITEFDHVVTKNSPYCVKGNEDYLKQEFVDKDQISLILVLYYLDNYKSIATLPDKVLNAFDEDMAILRNMGLKAIVRFAYTNDNSGEIGYDAPLDIVQSHISQYESHWKANADVIFCFQAGFVGSWGEWYYSSNFGNQESHMNDARRAVVDALLAAVPADRCIQLRTPLFKTDYVGNTTPLAAAEAYSGTAKSRLGHHNDAFLTSNSDMGTYTDPTTQKAYISKETLYVPLGGESCILDENTAKERASYDKTTEEMSYLHWTFIQAGYSKVVTNMWRDNGTFDELNRKLGYRFQLISGTFSDKVAQSSKLTVNIRLKNVGYAPLYNERHAYIVLKNNANTYLLPLASDPRSWLPNSEITTINEQLTVPSYVPVGNYRLYLYLPDAYETLKDDPRFAVRFANTGVWNQSTGMNDLNASVAVTAEHSPIDPPPTPPFRPAVLLPATLDKTNVDAYCDDMSWFNSDYFDFGPTDAANTDRWAEWKVELRYAGKYSVSEVMASVLVSWGLIGHSWQLQLVNDGSAVVSSYTTAESWQEGEITYDEPWDLTAVPAGNYTLHVQNVMAWAQPKLQSLTLQYNGEIPTDVDQNTNDKLQTTNKIIINNHLFIRRNGHLYNLNGQMIK